MKIDKLIEFLDDDEKDTLLQELIYEAGYARLADTLLKVIDNVDTEALIKLLQENINGGERMRPCIAT